MLEAGVADEGAAVYHVHVLHALRDFLDGDFSVRGRYAVALEYAFEAFEPLGAESLALLVAAAGHTNDEVRRRVVVKETFLKLRCVLVDFNLIGDGLRLTEAAKERVEGVELLHDEHIIDAHLEDGAGCRLDGVVRVVEVRRHQYPMGRYGPKLGRAACCVAFYDEIALAL